MWAFCMRARVVVSSQRNVIYLSKYIEVVKFVYFIVLGISFSLLQHTQVTTQLLSETGTTLSYSSGPPSSHDV